LNTSDIDLVYTWVDASDPSFRAELGDWKKRYEAERGRPSEVEGVAAHRFRDLDNLRHSLRSVERYMPWVRRIYLVTNGQVPRWLRENPRIELISHAQIAEPGTALPLFNAHPIEWQMPLIPGLSDRFIYFNDDFFVTRPTARDYFFGANGLSKIFLGTMQLSLLASNPELWSRMYVHNAALLDRRFGARDWVTCSHGPAIFDKATISELRSMWHEEIVQSARHRFREANDFHFPTVYVNAVRELDEAKEPQQRRETIVMPVSETRVVSIGHRLCDWRADLDTVMESPPRFLCLNDDMPEDETAYLECEAAHMRVLTTLFPEPSSFEKDKRPLLKRLIQRLGWK
jgi:hypothetical protein